MSIYICGFMGCGKTTLWKRLVEQTGLNGFDFDAEIEKRNSIKSGALGDFIQKHGWEEFRRQEIELLKESFEDKRAIYSLGGGTACIPSFEKLIETYSHVKVLWLNTPVDVCWERVHKDSNRPLIKNGKEAFYELFKEREVFYSKFKEINESYEL